VRARGFARVPWGWHEDRESYTACPDALRQGLCDDAPMGRTVLIVDDHGDFREAARALLEADGFSVVGEAAGGADAMKEVERLRPQVVLLDIQLPDVDGFAVAEQVSATPDPPVVVLVSSRDADAYGSRLEEARAQGAGFIAKRDLSGAALATLLP
jgi:CheY-like chemotaxis protein